MDDGLVLAMPRRELFRHGRFSAHIALPVLSSIAQESYLVSPATLAGDLEARRVRIALIVVAGDAVWVAEDGSAVAIADIPPDVDRFGPRLAGIRRLTQAGGKALIGADGSITLAGLGIDESLPGLADSVLIAYRYAVPVGTPAPGAGAWVTRAALRQWPVDPVSAILLPELFP
jgi:hypothetical protein